MSKPGKEFSARLKEAEEWRNAAETTIKEALSFCAPGREADFITEAKEILETEHYSSIAEECATDLAGDLITYYTPPEAQWASFLVLAEVEPDDEPEVIAIVTDREERIDDAIRASNYYDIAPQWAFEAASHGTAALWLDRGHATAPLHFEVIPPNELLVVPGHQGILDRFRKFKVAADTMPALFARFPWVSLSDDTIARKINATPAPKVEVVYGFWLDWSDAAVPMWRCEITVDGKRVTPETPVTLGPIAGSCPLLVGRFNPQPRKPWARGPGIKALPELRVLDAVGERVLSGLDQATSNTLIYADDGFLDLSNGIIAGAAYAANRGFTRDQVYELPKNVNVDQGWFTEDRIEDRIRRAFYQDGPRQRGETPPTASQWLDERRRVQQRLGKPSAPLWTELIKPMIQRVELLMVESGELDGPITHNGAVLAIEPLSPLQKAQNQDQVMVATANLQLAANTFQEALPQVIDAPKTMQNIIRVSGDKITVVSQGQPNVAPPPAGA